MLQGVVEARSTEEARAGNAGVLEAPEKRPRGRPKGSRNKFSADARAVLAASGAEVAKTLCRIAVGRAVFCRDKDPDTGRRRVLVPDMGDVLSAQALVISRLAPQLTAAEVTATIAEVPPEYSNRQLAMAMMALLRAEAKEPGAEAEAETPAGSVTSPRCWKA